MRGEVRFGDFRGDVTVPLPYLLRIPDDKANGRPMTHFSPTSNVSESLRVQGRNEMRAARRAYLESRVGITIFGISNCDTMKKARAWLDLHGVDYRFHDYKTLGIDRAHLERWSATLGWEILLNRAGTTFRRLPEERKQALDAEKAMALMLEQPSMIKRPVLELGDGHVLAGFKPEIYGRAFEPDRLSQGS